MVHSGTRWNGSLPCHIRLLCAYSTQNFAGGISSQLLGIPGDGLEVAAQNLQRVFLPFDFAAGPNAQAAQHRHWRTPFIYSMLQEACQNNTCQPEPFSIL